MNQSLYPIILMNLGILLIASWVFGSIVISRLIRENKKLRRTLKKKPDVKKKQTQPTVAATPEDVETDIAVDTDAQEESAGEHVLNAIDELKIQFADKNQNLLSLEDLHQQQKKSLEMWQQDDDENAVYEELLSQHQQSELLINQLKKDIADSQSTIQSLEMKLQDSDLKTVRINILEGSENRLKNQLKIIDKNEQQALLLAEGLRKSKNKNRELVQNNIKLKDNIKKMANASDEQRQLIQKISSELEKATQLERYQNKTITDLKNKLDTSRAQDSGSDKTKNLESELEKMQDTLMRTLREKEFIESHLLEMDKSLEKAKETEVALEASRQKIDEIKEAYPDFIPEENSEEQDVDNISSENDLKPLSKLEIDKKEFPELANIVTHNRLFGIVNEFWNGFDTPPMQLIDDIDANRPKTLECWNKTIIEEGEYVMVVGASQEFVELLTKAMIVKDPSQSLTPEQALHVLGEKSAIILAEELNPDYRIGAISTIAANEINTHLDNMMVAGETLQISKGCPLYVALLKENQ